MISTFTNYKVHFLAQKELLLPYGESQCMELAEILGNPLFVPLLVAILTILTTAYFNYWLRKWQYRREYVISNVEKTYIPILAEINEKLDGFDKFLEDPNGLDSTFAEMEKIRLSGLFEFVRSHDKKLHSKLELFYCKIYPRFRELSRLWFEFPRFIVSEWGSHIRNAVTDTKAKECSDAFVNELIQKGLCNFLFSNQVADIHRIWSDSLSSTVEKYQLYKSYTKTSNNTIYVSKNAKIPAFDVSEDEIEKLLMLSNPKVQNLLSYYNDTKTMVNNDVIKGLIPMMQKYITDPLAK